MNPHRLGRPAAGAARRPAPRLLRIVAACTLAGLLSAAAAQVCATDDGVGNDPLVLGAATCVDGTAVEDRQQRAYVVRVPDPSRRYRLVARADGPHQLDLCLGPRGDESCRRGDGSVALPDLVLPAGDHEVRLTGRVPAGGGFRVELHDDGPARDGFEREPNDRVEHATVLGGDLAIRGRLEGREQDFFRVDVTGAPQLWRVQVVGSDVAALRYHDTAGRVQQDRRADPGDRGIRMSNLLLMPGPHFFSVDGTDADYALRLVPLGPSDEPSTVGAGPAAGTPADGAHAAAGARPAPEPLGPAMTPAPAPAGDDMVVPVPRGPRPPGRMEREPNDDPSRAHLLRPDEPWVGLLSEGRDVDVYRFFLGEEAYVRITVVPPEDGAIEANASGRWFGPGVGEPYVYEAWHLAGDHVVSLRPATPSDAYYQITLELLDPFDLPDDLEPNDAPGEARPLPGDHEVRGTVGTHGDGDWYLLPRLDAETIVTADLDGDGSRLGFVRTTDDARMVASFRQDRESGRWHATVPAGGPYAASVEGSGPYHLRLSFDPGPAPAPRSAAPPVRLEVRAEAPLAAAFHHLGQRLQLRVELHNTGPERVRLELETHVSDHGWQAELEQTGIVLEGGASATVPLGVTVMPGARDDLGVRVTVAARSEGGGAVTAATELAAVCGAPAVDPRRVWSLPDPLLGGLNVAWSGLGAEPLTERRSELMLFDGLTPPGGGFSGSIGEGTTVRLAGDELPRVLGVLLHPLGAGDTGSKLADFRILTSLDGERFEPVYEGRMRSVTTEQAFPFPQGVVARYVRVEYLSRQDGARRTAALGQLKVIAEPTSRPFSTPIDLADRTVGGFVARSDPHLPLYALTEEQSGRPTTRRVPPSGRAHVVLGFHHTRTALLDALEWQPHREGDPEARIDALEVSVSVGDALGPWVHLGTWRPHERPSWRFDEPVWARFVRFDAVGLEPGAVVEYPAGVRVLEHPVGPDYRSVLGEWGHYAQEAAYEWRHPPAASAEGGPDAGNDTRERAIVLVSGDQSEGRVLVGEYDAWYRIDVPDGQNHLRLELGGEVLAYRYELRDVHGAAVAADVEEGHERVVLEAFVEPGSYYLRAWEPPRSVVFAWDNSGSMGPYVEATYGTITGFARDVSPEREQVQLLAFARIPRFLMPGWTGDPATVLSELLAYDRSDGSSDAELNFAYVVDQLADRDGTRAVLLVTDAESGAPAEATRLLWQGLETARPRVFVFETSTSASDDTQDRMQAWAVGGFYDYARTIGDLEVGFARASCLLRQPKSVRVAVHTVAAQPPGPGSLVVELPGGGADASAGGAVHVIYDASGSMGKLLPDGSSTRLAVARAILTEIVEHALEEGTPFALRAYGHVMPTSCDSRLELPLAALDRAEARRAIHAIEPKLLSGTPLAESIALAADDLAGTRGPVTVVLLTDGEETCGGDPEAAIADLMARGIDVRLSIVGFDLDADDPAAAFRRFEAWAELGGGRVYETASGDELREALLASLVREVPFEVLDGDGLVVAAGALGGAPVELPAGTYAVRVGTVPETLFEEVRIRWETRTQLVLEEE